MEKPKFMEENYHYFDKDDNLKIKDNAPKWAKEEYKEFIKYIEPTPNKQGIITIS